LKSVPIDNRRQRVANRVVGRAIGRVVSVMSGRIVSHVISGIEAADLQRGVEEALRA
jgi:hypothetical protein